ncbi:MAG: DUF2341 domain-containing protein, partial [Anaerolineales bacterium]|nr:DUF2341 domain-containing protein [Anaerolineales bacterium]
HNNQDSPATFHIVGSEEINGTFCGPDATTSTITAAPTSIAADGSSTSTITVQLKDSFGNNLISGSDTVTVASDLGSLSGTVTDNGDGTYTETLTSAAAPGTATITGTVNATPITDNATVDFTAVAWVQCDFEFRKQITIQSSQVVADQTDFPVLISLPSDSDLAADARNDGFDISFTASDGTTKLDHEIEYFNEATGELAAWVRIPYLSSSVDNDIYMYYGNPTSGDQSNPAGVWTASYAGVWHLDETPTDGAADSHENSVANNNHGTPQNFSDGGGGTTNDTGQIDGADLFGGDDDYVTVASPTGLDPANQVTVSAWVRVDGPIALNGDITSRGDTYVMRVWTNGQVLFSKYNGSSWINMAPAGVDIIDGGLHHIVVGQDATGMFMFIDGVSEDSNTDTDAFSYTLGSTFEIGRHGDGDPNYPFSGIIDQVSVATVGRSTSWIQTEYNNQKTPALFHSVGGEELNGAFCGADVTTSTITAYPTSIAADGTTTSTIIVQLKDSFG